MKNLNLTNNEIVQNNNCILCYRCANACPKKAITVLIYKKPKKQYKGVGLSWLYNKLVNIKYLWDNKWYLTWKEKIFWKNLNIMRP